MTTVEKNKLIAEFMGFEKTFVKNSEGKSYQYSLPNGFELIKEVETTIESQWCEVLEFQDYCMVEDLKFHTSWDWLMPIISKANAIMEGSELTVTFPPIAKRLRESFIYNDITTAFECMVEFIQWYNENKAA